MASTVSVGELIAEIEQQTPTASVVERVRQAQTRAFTLNEAGEQLVGYFVSRAKEAGASWSSIGEALGVSKQAAQQSGRSRYAKFTQRARGAVVAAQGAAREQRNHVVGTEHILLGLLHETGGLAVRVLAQLSDADVEAAVRVRLNSGQQSPPPAKIPLTPRATTVLDRAATASAELGHDFVGTEHLLLGLFTTGGVADEVLAELGLTEDQVRSRVRDEVANLIQQGSKDLPPPE